MRLSEVRPGVWKVVVYAGIDPTTGKQRQRTKTFPARGERAAAKLAHKHIATLQAEADDTRDRLTTVNGLVDQWQRVRDAADSPSTIRGRAAIIRRIRKGLGALRLEQLTARHVDQWMTDLRQEGLTDTNVFNHYSHLRAMLNQGDDWEMVTNVAAKRAKPPTKTTHRRPAPPTSAALGVLVDSAAPDLRVCSEIAAEVGMRRGEIVALRWSDIDWPNRIVNVNRAHVDLSGGKWVAKLPKSGRQRSVPVSVEFIHVLGCHRDRQSAVARQAGVELADDGFVVADLAKDPTGRRPRRGGWLTLAWVRHRRNHGADSTFHDLRHWSASELIDAGVPVTVVQKRLGHLQLSTTLNVYSHAVSASEQEAAATISRRRGRGAVAELLDKV